MPELPDIVVYLESLRDLLQGATILSIPLRSPFVLRTFEIPLERAHNASIRDFFRIGKRIVWELEPECYLVFHLMIAGRFHWKKKTQLPTGKNDLLAIQTDRGTMLFTEASSKKRAGLWVVGTRAEALQQDRGGLDVLGCTLAAFHARLALRNHTLKRALTDPTLFDGIGNAYSDEILHVAKLSPFKRTGQLNDEEVCRLFEATRGTLENWIARLRTQTKGTFPERVTAFRPEMAVHGKFKEPCPTCQAPVQRIVYSDNECNYCARCQTGDRVLADRSLSRLLKEDWPRNLDELEGGA